MSADPTIDVPPEPQGPPPAPMGNRGHWPVVLPLNGLDERYLAGILEIPGVLRLADGLACTWDIAWAVARLLRVPEPEVPRSEGALPGLARYRWLGLHAKTRPTQKEDVLFLARRGWAVLAEPMRSGKTLMALGASVLVDSRRTLVVCPKYARLEWAAQIQEWVKEGAALLCGRGAREVRVRCTTCRGRGELEGGVACSACRTRNGQSLGYRIYDVPPLRVRRARTPEGHAICPLPARLTCTRHPEVDVPFDPKAKGVPHCGLCHAAMIEQIKQARYVVVNYELLVQQHTEIGGGRMVGRDDLAGWVDTLKSIPFDVAICDEAQMLRGWSTSSKRRGEARNERTLELVGHVGEKIRIPRVWMMTGTPFYGFVRDIFWLLEIASGGLWGGDTRLRGRKFMARYCEGKKGTHGYEAKGRSVFAETELMRRLNGTRAPDGRYNFDGVMIQRTREELGLNAPMVRRVEHIEIDNAPTYIPGHTRGGMKVIAKLIGQLNQAKREALMDRFMSDLAEGNKIIVFTFHVPSAKKTFLAFEKELASPTRRTRMREVNAKVWLATGARRKKDSDDEEETTEVELTDVQKANWARDGDQRYKMAEVFREHQGAGVIVATIDSMPGALSLRGAVRVYFLDLHHSPGAIAQAENRPWHPEVKDLEVIYIIAHGTIDDHLEAEVLPKAETLARMGREKGAEAMLAAFSAPDETRTTQRVWDRLMRHLQVPVTDGLDEASGAEG